MILQMLIDSKRDKIIEYLECSCNDIDEVKLLCMNKINEYKNGKSYYPSRITFKEYDKRTKKKVINGMEIIFKKDKNDEYYFK